MALDAKDKITKAKIELLDAHPFFSYLVQHLKINEKNDMEMPTMAVDNYGNLYFDSKFVDKLSINELCGVLAHEALHCALKHIDRKFNRDLKIWNAAIDFTANSLIQKEGRFDLPEGTWKPDYNDSFQFSDFNLNNISKKCAEELYSELLKHATKIKVIGFDMHLENKGENEGDKKEKGNSSSGKNIDWDQVLSEAHAYAKMKGNKSSSLERIVENALATRIPWKQLLYKYITSEIASDYTYNIPSRRFYSTGYYLPSMLKRSIDIFVAIDVSGSISNKEIGMFLKEIIRIGNSFENIKITFLVHDVDIHQRIVFNKNNLNNLKRIKPIGGGGTSHKKVFEEAEKSRAKILVCFTDGESDIDKIKTHQNTIFVLTQKNIKPKFGKIIYVDDFR